VFLVDTKTVTECGREWSYMVIKAEQEIPWIGRVRTNTVNYRLEPLTTAFIGPPPLKYLRDSAVRSGEGSYTTQSRMGSGSCCCKIVDKASLLFPAQWWLREDDGGIKVGDIADGMTEEGRLEKTQISGLFARVELQELT
jgi:hypothetical protein